MAKKSVLAPFPQETADFEPGFAEALEGLRKLHRASARHNDFNGPMRLSSGQVLVLVDCALALMDRYDRKLAADQIRENFRYE